MSDQRLVPLDVHNKTMYALYQSISHPTPQPNGLACPTCGDELFDTNPQVILKTHPPKKDVHCKTCHFKDWRVV